MWLLVLIIGIKLHMNEWFWAVYAVIMTFKIMWRLVKVAQKVEE